MSHSSPSGSRNRQASTDTTAPKPPRPAALLLGKPLPASGSSLSVNEIATPPPTPGLRAHLGHLLPRHTFFRARIVIHQIQSVPLVRGEFGVRWKLKSVHTPPAPHRPGLLDRVMGAKGAIPADKDKGKAREDVSRPGTPTAEDGRVGSGWRRKAAAPPVHGSSSVSSRSSQTGHSQHLSADWASSTASGLTSPSSTTLSPPSSDTPGTQPPPPLLPASPTPARGMTPFLKLKDHAVVWAQTLEPLLRLDVDRETSAVLPCPLKLVVMQRVIPDDPDGPPQNPRLGALYLNLAEYIGQGRVERRYLLKESRTNATLKIAIEMEYVHGETQYVPPPLAKGEILAGIAGFLDQDVVRRRPQALDVYGPYRDQEELEIDLLGARGRASTTPRPRRRVSGSPDSAEDDDDYNDARETARRGGRRRESREEEEWDDEEDADDIGVAFDVQRLPFAYGTKTTETLIDALFNPKRITEKRDESPFTYYEAPRARTRTQSRGGPRRPTEQSVVGLGLTGIPLAARQNSSSTIGGSEYGATNTSGTTGTTSSSASVRTMTSESSRRAQSLREGEPRAGAGAGTGGAPGGRVVVASVVNGAPPKPQEEAPTGVRGWWKRHTTPRPATPTARRPS